MPSALQPASDPLVPPAAPLRFQLHAAFGKTSKIAKATAAVAVVGLSGVSLSPGLVLLDRSFSMRRTTNLSVAAYWSWSSLGTEDNFSRWAADCAGALLVRVAILVMSGHVPRPPDHVWVPGTPGAEVIPGLEGVQHLYKYRRRSRGRRGSTSAHEGSTSSESERAGRRSREREGSARSTQSKRKGTELAVVSEGHVIHISKKDSTARKTDRRDRPEPEVLRERAAGSDDQPDQGRLIPREKPNPGQQLRTITELEPRPTTARRRGHSQRRRQSGSPREELLGDQSSMWANLSGGFLSVLARGVSDFDKI